MRKDKAVIHMQRGRDRGICHTYIRGVTQRQVWVYNSAHGGRVRNITGDFSWNKLVGSGLRIAFERSV